MHKTELQPEAVDFEQKIIECVASKLNSGFVERLVEEKLEKGVSEALESIFSWSGEGKKLIEKKIKEVIVPMIEIHDFNQYLVKLDSCLTEIVQNTNLADNQKILDNFSNLMQEPASEEVTLSEIFERYIKHVQENVDTSNLEPMCEDGDPSYECVTATMEVKKDSYDNASGWGTAHFTCEEDESLEFSLRMFTYGKKGTWRILDRMESITLESLRTVSAFEIYLMRIDRAFLDIVIDTEYITVDDIEPDEKPEFSLS